MPFVEAHRERLACDEVVISDTGMFAPGLPALLFSLRGLAYFEVRVVGPSSDLHSGEYGGPVVNPAMALGRILATLHDDRGRITIDGHDIRDVTLASLRKNVGIVLQDVFVFSATLRDNIAYGVEGASLEDVIRIAKVAQLHDYIEALPNGYDSWVGERGVTLSGGQRQRLAIARTLLLDPPILILDDSTSSVDMGTEYQIQQELAEVIRGRTTFVIAHRLSTIRRADLVLVMDEGKIVERGSHQELLAHDGFYRRIHDLQLMSQEDEAVVQGAVPVPGGDA